MSERVDSSLVLAWLRARSVARGLPEPVADRGGWRVDAGTPSELCRYVFAEPVAGLRELGRMIDEPRILLKLCAPEASMRTLLPARWHVEQTGRLMTFGRSSMEPRSLPPGYHLDISVTGPVTAVRVLTEDGQVAASGYGAEVGGVFAYDRIATGPDYRRQGLARAVMSALASHRRSSAAQQVLVATPAGQALYETLGWVAGTPYTTALIPSETIQQT